MAHTHRYLEQDKTIYDLIDIDEISHTKMAEAVKTKIETLEDSVEFANIVNTFDEYKSDKNPDSKITMEDCYYLADLITKRHEELLHEKSIADQLAAINANVGKSSEARRAARVAAEAESRDSR